MFRIVFLLILSISMVACLEEEANQDQGSTAVDGVVLLQTGLASEFSHFEVPVRGIWTQTTKMASNNPANRLVNYSLSLKVNLNTGSVRFYEFRSFQDKGSIVAKCDPTKENIEALNWFLEEAWVTAEDQTMYLPQDYATQMYPLPIGEEYTTVQDTGWFSLAYFDNVDNPNSYMHMAHYTTPEYLDVSIGSDFDRPRLFENKASTELFVQVLDSYMAHPCFPW